MSRCITSPVNALQICHCRTWIKLTRCSLSGRMKGGVGTERRGNRRKKKGRLQFFFSAHTCCASSSSSRPSVCLQYLSFLSLQRRKDRYWRDLWIIIPCSPRDTEKLIGSQQGIRACVCLSVCVWVRGKHVCRFMFISLLYVLTFSCMFLYSNHAARTSVHVCVSSVRLHVCVVFAQILQRLFLCVCVCVCVCFFHFLHVEIRAEEEQHYQTAGN